MQNISLGKNGSAIAIYYPYGMNATDYRQLKPEVAIQYVNSLSNGLPSNATALLTSSSPNFGWLMDLANADNRIAIASRDDVKVFEW